ncbi:MAG: DUF58 domain-containing protein [Chloroflexi bacterium]|nr:DUF58 domain-containing protein [Chloroflexota bacterium]
MSRYRVILLLFIVTLIGALGSGRSLWWSFAGALFALIAVSVAWAWLSVNWLRIRRRTLTRVAQVGQTLDEEFVLANLSRIPKLWIEVRDQSTLPSHYASRVLGLIGPLQWRGWRVSTFCSRRGRYTLGPLLVRSGDPLGIYQMERAVHKINSILVYPAVYEFREFPLPVGHLPGGEALRRRTHYVTTNASGVRDYMTGDVINRIHWPLSTKRQRLTVKEFELDPMSDLWIMLDLQREAHVRLPDPAGDEDEFTETAPDTAKTFVLPPQTEEYAISMAASVAQHFLRQDRAVGLITYAHHREVLSSDRGERQINKLMEMLSVLRADGAVPFERVLRAEGMLLPRGATVIAISASSDVTWALPVQQLVRSGLRVVAIVIDAHTFSGVESPAVLIGALAEAGAVVRVIRRGESPAEAIGRPAVA